MNANIVLTNWGILIFRGFTSVNLTEFSFLGGKFRQIFDIKNKILKKNPDKGCCLCNSLINDSEKCTGCLDT